MVEDALDDGGVFNAGDDLDAAAEGVAGFDVDVEHTLQTLGLRLMAACRCAAFLTASPRVCRPRRPGVTCARRLLMF